MPPLTVYFIQAGKDGPIKIGSTDKDPARRMRELQVGNHEELRLLRWKTGTELPLHKRFAHLRIRGEWFRPDRELLDYIEHGYCPDHEEKNYEAFRIYRWAIENNVETFTMRDIQRKFTNTDACLLDVGIQYLLYEKKITKEPPQHREPGQIGRTKGPIYRVAHPGLTSG